MRRTIAAVVLAAVAVPLVFGVQEPPKVAPPVALTVPPPPAGPQIGHMVFFKLKDGTADNRAKLVASCDKYLSGHERVVYYSAGGRAAAFDREVNVKDWDVALHLVFADKAGHDKYQDHDRHKQFIAENKDTWESVRVFDSEVTPAKAK
jgi:Stress responsive A/B Barrel Domain